MRYIRNISDDQNKSGDTDNIFRFNLLQDDDIFNFGDYPISINIANSSGYILSMVPEKEFGNSVLKLDFNDQSLKNLTPDNYLLEVEVKFPDGTTATFPTKGGMPFTVNSNLKNTAGHLVPTVTFDEVLSAVDKKVNNYLATVVKGDKGDPGEKGDTGVVDTAKDYTWAGTNTFNQQINGSLATRFVPVFDFNTIASDTKKYSGLWVITGDNVSNGPTPDSTWGVIEVVAGNTFTTGSIRYTRFLTGETYITSVNSGIVGWYKVAKDNTVVHNTGTETVAGDKNFTGNNSFTNLINGALKTREATFTDFATVASDMKKYAGLWFVNDKTMSNSPVNGTLYGVIEVIPAYGSNIGVIRYSDTPSWRNGFYQTTVDVGNLNGWHKIADDATIVHNTGTETVSGDKTFTGNNTFTQNISGNITGNSGTTTKLQTARKINGTNFDGTADINVNAANDRNLVHQTGTESVAGDKTFTGNNTFTGQTSFWFKQIQWTSGIMQGTWYLQRMGNFVFARFEKSQNTGTGDTSLSLPIGYRPINNWILDAERGQAGIKGNGTVYIGTAYADNVSMTFVYPTNDAWPTA